LLLLLVFLEKANDTPAPTTPTTTTTPTTVPPQTTLPPETTVPPTTTQPLIGWVEQDGRLYYYDDQSNLVTGWQEIEGVTYYFNEDGSRALGKTVIDGKTRYFAKDGSEVLLVNPWNYLPEDYSTELATPTIGNPSKLKVSTQCYDALMEMLQACKDAGLSPIIVSANRTHAKQQSLFNNKVQKLMNQGYSKEEATTLAATVVAIPGTSEHELGLAVDLVDNSYWGLDEAQEKTKVQKWLMENAWEYGFILRYPNGKSEVTGIIYEPWHYRYVGVEMAKEIYDSGLTLEEYLENLGK
jgi:glucan-binding repeat-containing protein